MKRKITLTTWKKKLKRIRIKLKTNIKNLDQKIKLKVNRTCIKGRRI